MYLLGVILLLLATMVVAEEPGACFDFYPKNPDVTETPFLEFRPSRLRADDRSRYYSLEFQTREERGVLMYSEGPHDYEALFLLSGRLYYLLANPASSGVSGSIGGLYISDYAVNNGSWFTVEVFRNWRPEAEHDRAHAGALLPETGLKLTDQTTRNTETHIDHLYHHDVVIEPHIFIGGVKSNLKHIRGARPKSFVGFIRNIRERIHNVVFWNAYLNNHQLVDYCFA